MIGQLCFKIEHILKYSTDMGLIVMPSYIFSWGHSSRSTTINWIMDGVFASFLISEKGHDENHGLSYTIYYKPLKKPDAVS